MPRADFSVTIVTPDVVGARMAGPGIRAFHFARELARHFRTTLVGRIDDFTPDPAFRIEERKSAAAKKAIRAADVVIGQPTRELLGLQSAGQKFVFDLFDPVVLELRELYGDDATMRQSVHYRAEWSRLRRALARGDALIAATPRQRDFYAGVFAAADSIERGWLNRWLEVPFGAELAGIDDIEKDDPPVVVWNGGLWEWLDPELAIDAIEQVNDSGIACRLLFLGGARPNADVRGVDRLTRLQTRMAGSGGRVSANERWIPYAERSSWLARCKIAIMLHRPTLEAEFSIRTRLFDAIAAGLPVVATSGGFAAELVERERLGVVVPPSDATAVAGAVRALLAGDELYSQSVSNLKRLRDRYSWERVVQPLIEKITEWQSKTK
jgi:glycosyltransferase involved in cell wall biosynthesis